MAGEGGGGSGEEEDDGDGARVRAEGVRVFSFVARGEWSVDVRRAVGGGAEEERDGAGECEREPERGQAGG